MKTHKGHIHFIAIGGSAMHNLAIAMKNEGYRITGSDDDIFEPSRSRLAAHDLLPTQLGWFPDKITSDTETVILGMHARQNNPELKKAVSLNIPLYSFPEFVYQAAKNSTRIVIAGSHGKSTITSMVMHVLNFKKQTFDYLVGAGVEGFSNMVKLSGAPLIILEGDEYFSSAIDKTPKFIRYNHNIGLISGISWDHVNAFPTRNVYVDQFQRFIENTPPQGSLVFFEGDETLRNLIQGHHRDFNLVPYRTPDYVVENNRYFLVKSGHKFSLNIFGRHNMQNLAGATEVLKLLGLGEMDIYNALESFRGASNRLEKVFKNNQIVIYKDFAHSPSKLKSTTEAIRELYPEKRIVSCFELHTYSSLNKDFLKEYRNSYRGADVKIIFLHGHTLEIKKMPPLSDALIKEGFNNDSLIIIRSLEDLYELIHRNIQPNTVFLFMSSGNFGGLEYAELNEIVTTILPD